MKTPFVGGPLDGTIMHQDSPPEKMICQHRGERHEYHLEEFRIRGGIGMNYYRHESIGGPKSGILLFEAMRRALLGADK